MTENFRSPGEIPLAVIQSVASDLMEQGAEAVVLMGSHVRGDALPDSDIDIVVVGRGAPYRLERRDGFLLSISWSRASSIREEFRSPREAPGIIPGWRSARLILDPGGVAAMLKQEALEWDWSVVGDRACNEYVAEEITGLAEEVHKLVNLYATGNLAGAAVQRAILSFRMGMIMAIHLRLLFDTENWLWNLVSERMGELWSRTQARAFGLSDETFDETCRAALELYRLAAGEALPLLDERQSAVVDYACRLKLRARDRASNK